MIHRHLPNVRFALPVLAAFASLTFSRAFAQELVGPTVSAKSAIIMDAVSGQVLWEKDGLTSRFPASTTKIMTSILLIENCAPGDTIVAPRDIETVKQSSMHLMPGEKVPAIDMLRALLLRSANDGCVATAVHVAGDVPNFVRLMNERATQIGCLNTHFHNPNGLNDPHHTTCAYDLALMARQGLRYGVFRDVVKTRRTKITRSMNQRDCLMINHDRSLWHDPTMDGVKTGWTIPAGHCFVGSATRNGRQLIAVVLKSDHWMAENSELLDWAFAHFAPVPLAFPKLATSVSIRGETVKVDELGPVSIMAQKGVPELPPTAVFHLAPAFSQPDTTSAPVKKGDQIGYFNLTWPNSRYPVNIPAYAVAVSSNSTGLGKLSWQPPTGTGLTVVGVMIAGGMVLVSRARKVMNRG